MTILLWWWGIGAGTCFLAGLYLNWGGLKASELLILIVASIVIGIGGLATAWMIVYWFWDAWRSQFAVDEDGRILYPWRD